jgi:hypothetical protein
MSKNIQVFRKKKKDNINAYEIIKKIDDCEFWQYCYNYSCIFKQGEQMPDIILEKSHESINVRCISQLES